METFQIGIHGTPKLKFHLKRHQLEPGSSVVNEIWPEHEDKDKVFIFTNCIYAVKKTAYSKETTKCFGGKGTGNSAFLQSRRRKGPLYQLIKNRKINKHCDFELSEPFTKCVIDLRRMVSTSDMYPTREYEEEITNTCN